MCNTEVLQSFLDGELEPAEADAVRRHLAGCPDYRQELSRLRLLWLELELEKEEEIEIPMELPFIRQQAIASTGWTDKGQGNQREPVCGMLKDWPGSRP